MANEKEIPIKFTADTDKAKAKLSELQTSLKHSLGDIQKLIGSIGKELNWANLSKNTEVATKHLDKMVDSIGKLEGSFSKGIKEISTFNKQLNGTEKSANRLGNVFENFGKRVQIFFSYKLIGELTGAIESAVTSAVEMEQKFAEIQAITTATDGEMNKLSKTIYEVGSNSKYSVEELAAATVTLGQAGLSASQINDVLQTTSDLAVATGSSLQGSVDVMTSTLAVWGLNAEEATHLSDVMVTGMNNTKATLDSFRMGVQYAGATLASMNVSFEEFAAVTSAASNAGLRASVVGTGLRGVVSELIAPSKKASNILKELGLTQEQLNFKTQGLIGVLENLKAAGVDSANAYDLFGKRAAQFYLAAVSQLDVTSELVNKFDETGATARAAEKNMGTLSSQFNRFTNITKDAVNTALDPFIKSLTVLLKALNDLTASVVGKTGFSILISAGTIAALTKVSKNLYGLATGAQVATKAFMGLRMTLFGWVGLLLGIADAAYTIYKNFFDLGDSLDDINGKITEHSEKIDALDKVYEDLTSKGDLYTKNADALNRAIGELNSKYGDSMKTTLSFIKSNDNLAESYKRVLDAVIDLREAQKEELNVQSSAKLSYNRKEFIKNYGGFIPQAFGDIQGTQQEKGAALAWIDQQGGADAYLNSMLDRIRAGGDDAKKDVLNEIQTQSNLFIKDYVQATLKMANQILLTDQEITKNMPLSEEGRKALIHFETSVQNVQSSMIKALNKQSVEVNDSILTSLQSNYEANLEALNKSSEEALSKLTEGSKEYEEVKTKAKQAQRSLSENFVTSIDNFMELAKSYLGIEEDEGKKQNLQNLIKQAGQIKISNQTGLSPLEKQIELNKLESKVNKLGGRGRMPKTDALLEAYKLRIAAAQYPSERASAYRQGALNYLNENSTAGMSELYGYYSNKASKLDSLKAGVVNKQTLNDMKKSYGDLFDAVNKGQISVEEADRKSNNVVSTMLSLDKSIQQVEGEFGNLDNVSLDNINEQLSTLNDKLNAIRNGSLSPWEKFAEGWYKTVQEMAKQYDSVSLGKLFAEDVGNGLSDALYEISTSSKSVKESFKDMARSIVEDLNKMIIKMIVFKAIEAGANSFMGNGVEESGGVISSGSFTTHSATGGLVRGGTANRDSVGAKLMPGEYVLKKSAVDALGTNFLNDLNTNAAQTLSNTAAQLGGMSYDNESASEPSVVNVWVVSKEEEAQMGPNDIIATISRDIRNGGQTKRLIQSVVAGRK